MNVEPTTKVGDTVLRIGRLCVDPPLALAPMVGLSHSATRSLMFELGGVGLFFSEMLAATRLPNDNEHCSPMLVRSTEERPLFYQLFLADEKPIPAAIAKLQRLDAQGVDLNLGCPAPQLRKHNAGGYLAEHPERVRKIVSSLRKRCDLPLSAKIRLGRQLNRQKLVDFCCMLEGEGIDLLTVHGRLHGEKFCRRARWDWIGEVKRHVSVPVLANGGIFSVADAKKCLAQSQADGLMLGRGAMVRPWLFADIAKEIYCFSEKRVQWSKSEIYFRFYDLLTERFKVERRLGRLKQFTHYFAQTFPFGHLLVSAVQNSKSMDEAAGRADDFFQTNSSVI